MAYLGRRVGATLAVAAAVLAGGCVDKEKCDEAIRVTRDALGKEQPDIARQWRDRAWKICNDSTLTSGLDKEITDKEAELAKRVADNAKQIADAAQQRLNQATSLWKSFDHEAEKERTAERLDQFKSKAAQMAQGLPPEYAKQVEDYNESQYARRLTAIEAAAKK
jgi:hypothetical protein